MNRRLISTFMLSGILFLLLITGMNAVQAAPIAQESADETAADIETGEALSQPLSITVQQRLPISVDLSLLGIATGTLPLDDSFVLTLDLTIEFVVTDTMTSTVPSTVSLTFADELFNALPISLSLDGVTSTLLYLVPQSTITETKTPTEVIAPAPTVTATAPVTAGPEVTVTPEVTTTPEITVTPTVTPEGEVDGVAPTSNVTANLRSGPGTEFELVGTAPLGGELKIVGITEDGTWYLLADSTWIFGELVDDPPADVPIANQALIDQVAADAAAAAEEEEAAAATPEPEATDAGAEEPTAAATPTATPTPAEEAATPPALVPTPTPAAQAPTPTANTDANLRAGPGTEYAVVGGTITGQELDVVGQNAAGDWFLLSNGGWIADFLINNPPADAPIVADDASPLLTGDGASPVLVPTPGLDQEATTEAETDAPIALGLAENLYLDEVRTLVARYELAADAAGTLVADAEADNALLADDEWTADLSAAIATLQRTGQQIRALEPPPLFAAAQIDLRSASEIYDEAAALLESGAADASLEDLRAAATTLDAAVPSLQATQEKLSAIAQ